LKVAPKMDMEEMNKHVILGARAKEEVRPTSLSFHYA